MADGSFEPCTQRDVQALPNDPSYGTNITAAVLSGGYAIDLPGTFI